MSQEFNSCAHLVEGTLEYKVAPGDQLDIFTEMYDMQIRTQQELAGLLPKYNVDPTKLETVGEVFDALRENKQAFDDEWAEITDALPGKSLPDKDRSAVWKRWKSKYEEIRNIKMEDLSDEDKLELQFELVDTFHFYLNMMIILGVTPEKMHELYLLKNAENLKRWNGGY